MSDVRALEQNPAAPRRGETDDRIDQGRFADAVSSEQPENLPLLELQGHALQDVGVTVIGMYVLDFEERHASDSPEIDFFHPIATADLFRRPALEDFAEMEDGNMVRDIEHHVHVVLDQKYGEAWIEL